MTQSLAIAGMFFSMNMVNRNAIMVKPKQPYWDWANSLDELQFSSEDMTREFSIYLLPECDNDAQFERWLKRNYRIIFDNELEAMWRNVDDWPATRNFKTFRVWFDILYGSEVFDLGRTPLESEDF